MLTDQKFKKALVIATSVCAASSIGKANAAFDETTNNKNKAIPVLEVNTAHGGGHSSGGHSSAPSHHSSAPSYHPSAPSHHSSAPSYHPSAPSHHPAPISRPAPISHPAPI